MTIRIPDPKANTTTEAYLAYKAGYLEESELKPVLYEPYLHFDGWLAYWCGLTITYPNDGIATGKNLFNPRNATLGYFYISNLNLTPFNQRPVSVYMEISPNTTYTVTKPILNNNRFAIGTCAAMPSPGGTLTRSQSGNETDHLTITSGGDDKWLVIYFKQGADTTPVKTIFSQIQVEEGSSATDYEPFQATPEMLTDEEALVAYLSGVTNTYPKEIKDPYDVRIVGYLRHLASIRFDAPEYPVNNEEFYLSTMEPTHTSNPEPSADIELDTVEGEFLDLGVYGDTAQTNYSGKNLFNKSSTPQATYQATATTLDTGIKVTCNNTINYQYVRYLYGVENNVGDTFTLSVDASASSSNTPAIGIGTCDADGGNRTQKAIKSGSGSLSVSYTIETGVQYIYIVFYANHIGTAEIGDYVDYVNAQMEFGSGATPYEPYVGSSISQITPAPSPDYPQSINVVTGTQSVSVFGKNLFDKEATPNQTYGTTYAELDTGSKITLTSAINYAYTNFFYNVAGNAGQTITLSAIATPSSSNRPQISIGTCNSSGGDRVAKSTVFGSGELSASYTLEEGDQYIYVNLYASSSSSREIGDYVDYENVQLEFSSSPTDYQSHKSQTYTIDLGSTELCKISDYQDCIYKSDGNWYLKKKIKKVVYDGSQSWTKEGAGYFRNEDIIVTSVVGKYAISDNFMSYDSSNSLSAWNNYPDNVIAMRNRTTYAQLGIKTSVAETAAELKTWFSSHNTTAYFVLDTPVETQITDETLIGQLEDIIEGGSYDEKTYITVTPTGSSLPALLEVKAYKY